MLVAKRHAVAPLAPAGEDVLALADDGGVVKEVHLADAVGLAVEAHERLEVDPSQRSVVTADNLLQIIIIYMYYL